MINHPDTIAGLKANEAYYSRLKVEKAVESFEANVKWKLAKEKLDEKLREELQRNI